MRSPVSAVMFLLMVKSIFSLTMFLMRLVFLLRLFSGVTSMAVASSWAARVTFWFSACFSWERLLMVADVLGRGC